MLTGFVGLYLQSDNPLFLAVSAVVGIGVLATGTSMLFEGTGAAARRELKP
jgi:hypothetical protein